MISKGHIAVLKRYVKGCEKFCEQRIVAVVHDDKTGVDFEPSIRSFLKCNGIGVPADPIGGFKEGDLMFLLQEVRGG